MTRTGPGPAAAGLQAERTGLAWSRTSLGAAANLLLLAVHAFRRPPGPLTFTALGVAVVVVVATAAYGARRTALLRHEPLPRALAPRPAVPLLGGSVAVLAVLTVLAVIV